VSLHKYTPWHVCKDVDSCIKHVQRYLWVYYVEGRVESDIHLQAIIVAELSNNVFATRGLINW